MIAYKRQKCQNKNKAKKGEKFKAKKLGRAFANLALAKAQVKRNGHQTFATKKISGKQEIAKPNNNLQKWITKTAKNYQKDKIRQALQPSKRY